MLSPSECHFEFGKSKSHEMDLRTIVREDRNSASKYRALEKNGRWRRIPPYPLLGGVQRFSAP
jgi:hypothetical protein